MNDAANRTQLSFREDLRYRLIAELGAQPEAGATLWGPVAGPAGFTLMSVLSQRAALPTTALAMPRAPNYSTSG